MSTIRPPIPRTNTIAAYISSIGYCCPFGFFQLYPGPKWTRLVADRLGVTPRAVRYCRLASKECPHAAGCQASKIAAQLLTKKGNSL